MSQLELSLAAGVSQRHVSFLETGRSRPTRAMILRLGRALHLPLREQNRLLELAGHAGSYAQRSLDDPELAPVRQALSLMLAALEPNPVLVVDGRWEVLESNRAAMRLLRHCLAPEALAAVVGASGRPNLMRLMVHPQGLRACVRNWDDVAAALALRIERELAEAGADQETARLLDEMRTALGPVVQRPTDTEAVPAPVLPLSLAVPGFRVDLFSTIATFGTAQDVTLQELRIESFFPANAESAQALRRLAEEDMG